MSTSISCHFVKSVEIGEEINYTSPGMLGSYRHILITDVDGNVTDITVHSVDEGLTIEVAE